MIYRKRKDGWIQPLYAVLYLKSRMLPTRRKWSAYQTTPNGLTLVELLMAIGSIAVLVTIAILIVKPTEVLKKRRDATRFSDMKNLRDALDRAITDEKRLQGTLSQTFRNNSADPNPDVRKSSDYIYNYVGLDVSKYLDILPIDPRQNSNQPTTISDGTTLIPKGDMVYSFGSDGQYYELNTYLESTQNNDKVLHDGGDNDKKYEVGTDPGLTLLTD